MVFGKIEDSFNEPYKVVVEGEEILSVDLRTKTITLCDGWKIKSTGNFYIDADKHILVNSGCDDDPKRPGYRHSVWINTPIDGEGYPVKANPDTLLKLQGERSKLRSINYRLRKKKCDCK